MCFKHNMSKNKSRKEKKESGAQETTEMVVGMIETTVISDSQKELTPLEEVILEATKPGEIIEIVEVEDTSRSIEGYAEGYKAGRLSAEDEIKLLIQYDPAQNPKVICLIQREDGNWTAEGDRFGKVILVRSGTPQSALEYLLVHNGVIV